MSTKKVVQKFIIFSLFLLSFVTSTFAQGIKGRVLIANTGEPLVGATVSLDCLTSA